MATELVKTDQLNASFQGMTHLPVVRQVGLLVGLAASIALGVYVVLWSRTPDYSVLYHQVSARDAGEIANVLQQQNIKFKVNTDNGLIMVDSSKVHQARMVLAAQDLPHSANNGFDLIEKDQGFGTSDFIQNARYQRALEGAKCARPPGPAQGIRVPRRQAQTQRLGVCRSGSGSTLTGRAGLRHRALGRLQRAEHG